MFKPLSIKLLATSLSIAWAVLIIASSWYYRDDLFQTLHDPRIPFQTYTQPPPPDYSDISGWLARPDKTIDPIAIKGGDVFVVSPTVYLGRGNWNAPVQEAKIREHFNRVALPNYVQPYRSAGRLYAPYYRQASLYTFLTNREDAQAAQKLAYDDIRRAFEVFLQENPPERPIVLVGHGQGGHHVTRLLAEYFSGALSQKLAAAYVIDHPQLLADFDTQLSKLHPCETAQDSNCVIAFGAFQPNEKIRARHFVGKTLVWQKDRLESVNQRELLCINPLVWNRSTDYTPARLHLGGVAAEGLDVDTLPAPAPQQTGAQCMDGILLLDKPKQKNLRRPSRFGGKYRTLPFNIFYEDLRVDAVRRVQNLIDKDVLPRRAPLLQIRTIEVEDSPITLPLKPIKKN